jgi:hypothetical protein
MKLDAFVLNPALWYGLNCNRCAGPVLLLITSSASPAVATVAPITQPNYPFLKLNQDDIQSDLLNHVDLHAAIDKTTDPRIFDLGARAPITGRIGVYLH